MKCVWNDGTDDFYATTCSYVSDPAGDIITVRPP